MTENLFPLITKHFKLQPSDEKRIWDQEWNISLVDNESLSVGKINFEDGVFNGEVKIKAELDPEYEKTNYEEELFYSMARFVFMFKDIREISTVCRHENEHRVRGLEKAGYVHRQFKDGDDYYSMKKQKTSWTGFYVFVGLIAGFIIGLTISNLWMGTIGGVLIGTVIGYLMDKRENDK